MILLQIAIYGFIKFLKALGIIGEGKRIDKDLSFWGHDIGPVSELTDVDTDEILVHKDWFLSVSGECDKPQAFYTTQSVLKPGHKNSPPPQGGTHLTDLKYVYKDAAAFFTMKSKLQGGRRSTHSQFPF